MMREAFQNESIVLKLKGAIGADRANVARMRRLANCSQEWWARSASFRSHRALTNRSMAMLINLDRRSTPGSLPQGGDSEATQPWLATVVTVAPAVACTVTSRPTDLPAQPPSR